MARRRVSTTVDDDLLRQARRAVGRTDAVMLDEALRALLARHRTIEIDAEYDRAYSEHPLSEPDEWGDLASWNEAAAQS